MSRDLAPRVDVGAHAASAQRPCGAAVPDAEGRNTAEAGA